MRFSACLLISSFLLFSIGCSSIIDAHKQKAPMMSSYASGNLKMASEKVKSKLESSRGSGDQLMWELEAGTVDFDKGNYTRSLTAFTQAEQIVNDYNRRAEISARDIGAEASSALTNLNALPYKGFCYDRILLNVYKVFDYFAKDNPSGAMVELRRMRYNQKQVAREFKTEIEQQRKAIQRDQAQAKQNASKMKKRKGGSTYISFNDISRCPQVTDAINEANKKSEKTYGNLMNPFATYMSALGYLYEDNQGEALVDFRNLYRMNKTNPLTNRDYITVAAAVGGEHLPTGLSKVKPFNYPLTRNIVFIIFANGRGPALIQQKFQIILPWLGYTGLAFPRYKYYPAFFKSIQIESRNTRCNTVTVADMDNVASQEYRQRLPIMITRIVVSYLVKELASLAATQAAAQQDNVWIDIAAYASTGLYKYLFNTADTRCWETLPKQYQIAHLPIPADRKLHLRPVSQSMTGKTFTVELKRNTTFAIVYIRGTNHKIITRKVFEFNQENQ